jgi:hypothetical protein
MHLLRLIFLLSRKGHILLVSKRAILYYFAHFWHYFKEYSSPQPPFCSWSQPPWKRAPTTSWRHRIGFSIMNVRKRSLVPMFRPIFIWIPKSFSMNLIVLSEPVNPSRLTDPLADLQSKKVYTSFGAVKPIGAIAFRIIERCYVHSWTRDAGPSTKSPLPMRCSRERDNAFLE